MAKRGSDMSAATPNLLISALSPPPIPSVQAWGRDYNGSRGPLIDLSQAVPGYPTHPDMLRLLGEWAGAQAMTGGSLHEPLLTVVWPGAHLGPMGLEGAVRLGLRKELDTITDEAQREERVQQATAAAQENAKALNAAVLFEIDDVIDPADTRGLIATTLVAASSREQSPGRVRFVDTW